MALTGSAAAWRGNGRGSPAEMQGNTVQGSVEGASAPDLLEIGDHLSYDVDVLDELEISDTEQMPTAQNHHRAVAQAQTGKFFCNRARVRRLVIRGQTREVRSG